MQKYGISQGLLNCCYTVKYPTECKKQSPQLIVPTDGSHSGMTQTGGEVVTVEQTPTYGCIVFQNILHL